MTCTNTGCQLELRDTSHLLENKNKKTPKSGAWFCRFMTSALKTDSFVLDWYLLPFTSCILIFVSVCVVFLSVWYGSISDTGGVVISIVWFWHCAIWPLSKVTHFFAIATHYIGHKSGGTLIQQLLQPRSFWIFFTDICPCHVGCSCSAHCPCRSSNGRDYSIGMHHSPTNMCPSHNGLLPHLMFVTHTMCWVSRVRGGTAKYWVCLCCLTVLCFAPVSLFGLEPAMLHCASSRQSVTKHAGGGWDSPRRSASVPACWAVYQRNHHQHLLLAFIIIIIIIAVIIIIVITKHCERQGFLSPRHWTWLLVGWLSSLWSTLASASASSWYFCSALYNVLHTSPHRVQLITSRITAMLIKTLKCLLHIWVFDEDCCYLLCRCMLFGKIWCGSQHFSRMKHRGGMECKRTELKS